MQHSKHANDASSISFEVRLVGRGSSGLLGARKVVIRHGCGIRTVRTQGKSPMMFRSGSAPSTSRAVFSKPMEEL